MLAAVTLVAGLFGAPRPSLAPVSVPCPSGPVEKIVTTVPACPAVEISGDVEGRSVTLDPAFDVKVAPGQLARPVDSAAVLIGSASDGRRLFVLPIAANGGAFHLYVPLAPAAQTALAKLSLSTPEGYGERVAPPPNEAAAEIISIDDKRVIVAWNAAAFPAIRVSESPDGRPIADGAGTSTFEQVSIDTRARYVFIAFSDGVRSITRGFAIFGR